jgi:hypothetical protein
MSGQDSTRVVAPENSPGFRLAEDLGDTERKLSEMDQTFFSVE